jgi:hypothetical protein
MNNQEGTVLSWVGTGFTFMTIPINETISAISGLATIGLTAMLIYKNYKELKK